MEVCAATRGCVVPRPSEARSALVSVSLHRVGVALDQHAANSMHWATRTGSVGVIDVTTPDIGFRKELRGPPPGLMMLPICAVVSWSAVPEVRAARAPLIV